MKARRRKPKVLIPLTSMGDIAFLLIIFFVLVSDIAKDAGVKVTPPVSRDVEQLEKSRIKVKIDEAGIIYLDTSKVPTAKALTNALEIRLRDVPPEDTRTRTVWFECDRTIPKATFEPVLDAISEAGGIIAAVGEEGKPERPSRAAGLGPEIVP